MSWFSIIGQDCCHILWQYALLYLALRLVLSARLAFYLSGLGILLVAIGDIAFYGVTDIFAFIWRILCGFIGMISVIGMLEAFRSWNNRPLFPSQR